MSSRKIEDMTLETQGTYWRFSNRMREAMIEYIVTCTKRFEAEQIELYKKGREYRDGIWVTVDPKKCVTWTLKSKHIEGKAFDICILVNGKPLWNADLDVDKDGVAEYTEAGIIGEQCGLKWGGRFKDHHGKPNPDAPHFEV
jgi:peptidoglycan L-alanyl-D-glutamate endopeptidase CwlK